MPLDIQRQPKSELVCKSIFVIPLFCLSSFPPLSVFSAGKHRSSTPRQHTGGELSLPRLRPVSIKEQTIKEPSRNATDGSLTPSHERFRVMDHRFLLPPGWRAENSSRTLWRASSTAKPTRRTASSRSWRASTTATKTASCTEISRYRVDLLSQFFLAF